MMLQRVGSGCEFSAERFVVFLECDSSEQVEAMELVEDLHANAVAFLTRLWMSHFDRRPGHAESVEVGFRDPLVSHCAGTSDTHSSFSKWTEPLGTHDALSYEISRQALSTSGPAPTKRLSCVDTLYLTD